MSNRYRQMAVDVTALSSICLIAAPALAGGEWVTYVNETSVRLSSDSSVGLQDNQEKDYAWGDIDQDGHADIAVGAYHDDTLAQDSGVCRVFSGDTVVDRAHWGTRLLGRHFLGYLFAQLVYARVLAEGPEFHQNYVELLRRTGWQDSEELARETLGLDLTDPETWWLGIAPLEGALEAWLEASGLG